MRFLYRLFFHRLGWKIEGKFPHELNKFVIIVAPHTSNWDFFVGLAVRSITGFKGNFLGKKELFRPPFGWLFRSLGGFPVDRSKARRYVDQVVELIKKEPRFILAIAPEGTRKKVDRWKTGFYQIACKSGIPIVMASFDYPSKTVTWSKPFMPVGNLAEDAKIMESFFNGKHGKNRGVMPILRK